MKMIKYMLRDRSNREECQDWSKSYFRSKRVVNGTNGYSGKFGDEEASMLKVDGKGVANFKNSVTGIAEYGQSVDGEINELKRCQSISKLGKERSVLIQFSI